MNSIRGGRTITIFALLTLATAAPAFAQIDFSGEWAPLYHEDAPERGPGPELGDYLEMPINDAARLRADSWDADRISVVQEYQCRPHAADYALRGLGNIRIWREIDTATQRLIAFHMHFLAWDSERTVWMDGRPHPGDYAPHTWQGFSTGVWEGNMLTITTTHLKANYLRRNGLPRSEKAILTEHWTRHADWLTIVSVIEDPVFLTEPLVRSDTGIWIPGKGSASSAADPVRRYLVHGELFRTGFRARIRTCGNLQVGMGSLLKQLAVAQKRCIRNIVPSYATISRPRSVNAIVHVRR